MTDVNTTDDATVPTPIPSSEVESRLRKLSHEADEWIDGHAEQFDPLVWADVEKRHLRRKSFVEVALYLHTAEGHEDSVSEQLKDLVLERANDESYLRLLARNPREIHKYGYPLAYASNVGELSEEAADVFDRVLERRAAWSSPLPPFRTLDTWHLAQMYGYDVEYYDLDGLLETCCVMHPLNPAEVTREDAYGLTHVFLYYHNFGNSGEGFPDEPMAYEYPETIQALLLRFVARGDCDLVGELLISGALQRQLPPGLVRFALGWYLEQVLDNGRVPCPGDGLPIGAVPDSEELADLDMGNWDDESTEWGRYYHPTLVGATAGRILRDAWPELEDSADRDELDYESAAPDLYTLGEVFEALAEYDLQRGAELLGEVAGTPTAEVYDDVVEYAVTFLENQRRPDGKFGYWTDEKRVFLSMDDSHDEETFREELLGPTSETCEAVLDEIRGE